MNRILTLVAAAVVVACFSTVPATVEAVDIDIKDFADFMSGGGGGGGGVTDGECRQAFLSSNARGGGCSLSSASAGDGFIVPADQCMVTAKCNTSEGLTLGKYNGPVDQVRRLSNCGGRLRVSC